jgi:hypothetical protein
MPAMRCLSLHPEESMHFQSMANLIRNCPGLRTFCYQFLSEYGPLDQDNFLPTLTQYCPKLQTLRYDLQASHLSELTQLVQSCVDLSTVDIERTGDCLAQGAVLTLCKKLRALRVPYLEEAMVPMLQERMPELEHLSTNDLQCDPTSLAEHCGNLRTLDFEIREEPCMCPSASTMGLFLAKLVRVERLVLQDPHWLTGDLLLTIAAHCKRLRCFAIDGTNRKITANSISALIRGCPLLTEIIHGSFDDLFSVPANRAVWCRLRRGLTIRKAYRGGDHWDNLVYSKDGWYE